MDQVSLSELAMAKPTPIVRDADALLLGAAASAAIIITAFFKAPPIPLAAGGGRDFPAAAP